MTRFVHPDGSLYIKWDDGDPVDWTTPDCGDGIDDEYCGNCGLDVPGCGCPRDQRSYSEAEAAAVPVQGRNDPPLFLARKEFP